MSCSSKGGIGSCVCVGYLDSRFQADRLYPLPGNLSDRLIPTINRSFSFSGVLLQKRIRRLEGGILERFNYGKILKKNWAWVKMIKKRKEWKYNLEIIINIKMRINTFLKKQYWKNCGSRMIRQCHSSTKKNKRNKKMERKERNTRKGNGTERWKGIEAERKKEKKK